MFAVVETGGKQYRVSPGSRLMVESLEGRVGEKISLDRVLLIDPEDGDPLVSEGALHGARVSARIVEQGRGKKELVFKYKPKKRYRVKTGHRQAFTLLEVEEISLPTKGK